jgi:hypothetical protein
MNLCSICRRLRVTGHDRLEVAETVGHLLPTGASGPTGLEHLVYTGYRNGVLDLFNLTGIGCYSGDIGSPRSAIVCCHPANERRACVKP